MTTDIPDPLVGEAAEPSPREEQSESPEQPTPLPQEAMNDWVEVSTIKELTRHKKKLVSVRGQPVALFFVNERVYALHDTCMHKERSLSKGTLLRGRVICPGHQWAFELETGWVEVEERCQPTYEVRVENDIVYVNAVQRVLIEAAD